MPNIPTPEVALEELSGLFPVVFSALEYGVIKAREFFELQAHDKYRALNCYLAPDLVRFYAIQVLETEGHDIKTEDDIGFGLAKVPNNGILISYGQYNVRILKSDNGKPPVPGQSLRRQMYYHQMYYQIPFPFWFNESVQRQEPTNLLLLWDADSNYSLKRIHLVCPKAGGQTRDSVELHWHCTVPDSFLVQKAETDTEEEAEIFDLPLAFTEAAKAHQEK